MCYWINKLISEGKVDQYKETTDVQTYPRFGQPNYTNAMTEESDDEGEEPSNKRGQ